MPETLISVAQQVRFIWKRVSAEDPDLYGGSLLDLMADNITQVSLEDLKAAIVVSGIYREANPRIRHQIASYNAR